MARTRTLSSADGATSVREIDDREDRRREPGRRELGRSAESRRDRQKDEFGGFSWLSTLAGWLSAAGLTAILTGILSGAGAALALNKVGGKVSGSEAETIGVAGGIALLVVLAIGYFFGGYVAGRMARFDGPRQGLGVWLWGILIAVAVAALAAIGGSKYNVLDALNLPRLPVDSGTLTTGGLIALIASLAVTLGAAILGGKTGERFHKKVDRV